MDSNLLRYVWTHTRPQQVWILFVVLASMPTYFLALDLPKQIVNGPIQGRGFETTDARDTVLSVTIGLPDWIATGELVLFSGFDLSRYGALYALCAAFLTLVIVNGVFKLYINTYKGKLGERMLRRLRYDLLDRVLRFPLNHFRRVKASELASMIKDEVEPMGGFVGDAFVQPFFLGGQALTVLLFIFIQNVWLGAIAFTIVAVQGYVIPRLRRRLIELGKERQLTARQLAGRVSEVVDGIGMIHTNDTSNFERADMGARLGRILTIRYELYQRKFFVKFLNNFLAQVTPFLFYAVGGYFALRGRLDIGQLVAVIAAYKDLPSPIKELIDWDQQRLDVQVKFAQVAEQFNVDNTLDPRLQALDAGPVPPLAGPLTVSNVRVVDDTGATLIEQASATISPGETVAIVGPAGSGADTFAELLARLQTPAAGRVGIGGDNLFDLPEAMTGRRIGYAGPDVFLPQGSVRDNLVYVLKHAPLSSPQRTDSAQRIHADAMAEARRAGNPDFDPDSDWIDYAAAAAGGPGDLPIQVHRALRAAGLFDDVLDFGLRGVIDADMKPDLAQSIVAARKELRRRLAAPNLKGLVAHFDRDQYNREATLAENFMFGTPVGPAFSEERLVANSYIRRLLDQTGLDEILYAMGIEIAATTIELFQDLAPGHPFFEQLSFMDAQQIPEFRSILQRLQNVPFAKAGEADRQMIIRLPLAYIEPRHRLGLLDAQAMQRVVAARRAFHEGLPGELAGSIEFYNADTYNKAATIQSNILLGRIAHGVAGASDRINLTIRDLLVELDLQDDVFDVGLDFNVGSGGKRLTVTQRQKLALARVVLKRPDIAIFNRPLGTMDRRAQEKVAANVLGELTTQGRTCSVVWVVGNPHMCSLFGRTLVFDNGILVEQGKTTELLNGKSTLATLVA